jgi:hypothetical protein
MGVAMIDINLLEPNIQKHLRQATPRSSGRGWLFVVLLNLILLVVIVGLVMLLPPDTPGVGPVIQPARIALSRLFNLILTAF